MKEGVTLEFYFSRNENSALESITSKVMRPYEQARKDYVVNLDNKIVWGQYYAPSSMIAISLHGEPPELEKAIEHFLTVYGWKPWGAYICKPNSVFKHNLTDTERGIEMTKGIAMKMGLDVKKVNWLNKCDERPWEQYRLYKKKDMKLLSKLWRKRK